MDSLTNPILVGGNGIPSEALTTVSGAREIPIILIPGPCFPRPFPYDPILLVE